MRKELDRKIVLEDGSEYLGWGFGDTEVTRVCEIVFNTAGACAARAPIPRWSRPSRSSPSTAARSCSAA